MGAHVNWREALAAFFFLAAVVIFMIGPMVAL